MPPKKPVAAKAPVKAAAKPAPRPAAGRGTTPAAKKGAVAPGINFIFTIRTVRTVKCCTKKRVGYTSINIGATLTIQGCMSGWHDERFEIELFCKPFSVHFIYILTTRVRKLIVI